MDTLDKQILHTLKFFNLQSVPLTAFEIHSFLIAPVDDLVANMDDQYELLKSIPKSPTYTLQQVWSRADKLADSSQIGCYRGYYFVNGQQELVWQRLRAYGNGLKREKKIRLWLLPARHLPFIRGIALAGSQALGMHRPESDIDLLIITDNNYLWLARTLLTAYFQILGVRRYGAKIANRFCLNHYLAKPRLVDAERNLYKAMEYAKLRPVIYPNVIAQFQRANLAWIKDFFPNFEVLPNFEYKQSLLQKCLEQLFTNSIGSWLETKLKKWQLSRIKTDKFIFVREDELSFHPASKHEKLLQGFFG